jgi:hypothetical protein
VFVQTLVNTNQVFIDFSIEYFVIILFALRVSQSTNENNGRFFHVQRSFKHEVIGNISRLTRSAQELAFAVQNLQFLERNMWLLTTLERSTEFVTQIRKKNELERKIRVQNWKAFIIIG